MATHDLDEGAMIWSAPETARVGRHLLVLMHGHGGVERDLVQVFGALPQEVVAVSVRAPVVFKDRWTWADSAGIDQEGLDASVNGVSSWLDPTDGWASIGLLGFSEGGAVALQLLRRFPHRFAYGMQLSGLLASGQHAGDSELARVRPPVFSGHGELDDVIAVEDVERMGEWLRRHTNLTERRYRAWATNSPDSSFRTWPPSSAGSCAERPPRHLC